MACSITPFRYNSTTQLALHSTDYYSTLKNVYYWTPVEPDVPSILGRNLNLLLFLALNVRNMIFTYNRLLNNVLLLIGSQKVLKFPQKRVKVLMRYLWWRYVFNLLEQNKSISIYIFLYTCVRSPLGHPTVPHWIIHALLQTSRRWLTMMICVFVFLHLWIIQALLQADLWKQIILSRSSLLWSVILYGNIPKCQFEG